MSGLIELPAELAGDDLTSSLAEMIRLCGSFLSIKEDTVNFVHQSAQDFLQSSSGPSYLLQPGKLQRQHCLVFARCISRLKPVLCRNIYCLKGFGPWYKKTRPPEPDPLVGVEYSLLFWTDHLNDSVQNESREYFDTETENLLEDFLSHHFLHWLEALSLKNMFPRGLRAILTLDNQLKASSHSALWKLVHDAGRFMGYHRIGIESNPLQVYSSALIFSPTQSLIRQLHEEHQLQGTYIAHKPQTDDTWESYFPNVPGDAQDLQQYSLIFSPNGQYVASISENRQITLQHASTGEHIHDRVYFNGHIGGMMFSPDSTKFVAAINAGRVRVWSLREGDIKTLYASDEYHSDTSVNQVIHDLEIESVIVLSDGSRVASGSEGFVKVWDLATEECTRTITFPKWEAPKLLSLTDDRLVAHHIDKTVVWNTTTGALLEEKWDKTKDSASQDAKTGGESVTGNLSRFESAMVSAHGQYVALTTKDRLHIYNMATRGWQKLHHRYSGRLPQQFVHDGHLVTYLDGDSLNVWSASTGEHLQRTNLGQCRAILSPNGKYLHVALPGSRYQLLDATSGAFIRSPYEIRLDPLAQLYKRRYRPSGIIPRYRKGDTEQQYRRRYRLSLCRHLYLSKPIPLAFSPDSRQMSAASTHGVVVWDVETGDRLKIFGPDEEN